MLIQPDTYIRLIKNCPLDNRYEHTIYFPSLYAQELHFKNLPAITLEKQSYQRYANGVLTIQSKIENLYNCNYLMFRNQSFENKWFYAFITKIEYVNNVTCRLYYELDIMQTWFFDYTLEDCFVEREHSKTDIIGENLIHEDVYFGPYTYGEQITPRSDDGLTMKDLSVVIMYNPSLLSEISNIIADADEFRYKGNFYGGVYNGVNFLVFPSKATSIENLNKIISSIDFTSFGGFLSAFMIPTMFLPFKKSEYNEYNNHIFFDLPRNTTFDGYTPKNNKLFTYPYTCANLTANRSGGNDFAFEYFLADESKDELVGSVATFMATGNLCANPASMAYPLYYKNVFFYTEGGVTIPSYPMCTWGSDGMTEWVNNHLLKTLATVGVTSALGGVSPATALGGEILGPSVDGYSAIDVGSAVGPVMSSVGPTQSFASNYTPNINWLKNGITTLNSGIKQGLNTHMGILGAIGMARSEFDPGNVHGNVDGDVLMGTEAGREIVARVKHITKHYAKIVDDYFSRFGYATMQIKKPNRNVRPFWTYVKTKGCNITSGYENENGDRTGGLPSSDLSNICAIYDRGITFWQPYAVIGDYTQDNSASGGAVG